MYMYAGSFKGLKTILAVSNSISSGIVDQPSPLISGSEVASQRLLATIQAALFCDLSSLSNVLMSQHPNTEAY